MMRKMPRHRRWVLSLQKLRHSTSGVALVEFAVVLPVFMSLGMYGTEIAYMASVRMQVSQIAISLADNASRLGQTDNSGIAPTLTEGDIDGVLDGMLKQGESIQLARKGRVILSSLEYDERWDRQKFGWQRCQGALKQESRYGDGYFLDGLVHEVVVAVPGGGSERRRFDKRIDHIGGADARITAFDDVAVMVAEVYYGYQGIFGSAFVKPTLFRQEATFIVRDDRNLSAVSPGTNVKKSICEQPAYRPDQYVPVRS